MLRPIHILSGALLFAAHPSIAMAQIAPQPENIVIETTPETSAEEIEDWIEQLGSDDWLMRDLATLELAELDPGVTLETLEGHIIRNDLTPEQRARLWLACLRRFEMRPKGALGVQFGQVQVGAIEVIPIPDNPEFPASMILREGDRIVMVGERVLENTEDFRAEILSRDPGGTLPVTLVRGDRILRFTLELGAYSSLTGGARMDSDILLESIARRWARIGIRPEQPGTVGTDIEIDDWARAAFPDGIVPDPREPELVAPRGFVLGPGMRTTPDGSAWGRSIFNIWTDPADMTHDVEQRGSLMIGQRLQPLVALSNLLNREREQIESEIASAPNDEAQAALQERLREIDAKLERVRLQTGLVRNPEDQP